MAAAMAPPRSTTTTHFERTTMAIDRSVRAVLAVVVAGLAMPSTRPAAQSAPPATSDTARWEDAFRALPDAANIRAYDQRLSARPHHVGSPYDRDNAEWLMARFREW